MHLNNADAVSLGEYDLVYCQHQILSVFLDQLLEIDLRNLPLIIYAHLSPHQPLEYPGAGIEAFFADHVLSNSRETKDKLVELGVAEGAVRIFPNPAPEGFFEVAQGPKKLSKLLAISNHMPKEALHAFAQLEARGVSVTRVGKEFGSRRIQPTDLAAHDAVFTIGKSAQFALAARRPVYVYDYFGGPGWLRKDNFATVAEFNFSGRCCNRKLKGNDICREVIDGFQPAFEELANLEDQRGDFRLRDHLAAILEEAKRNRAEKLAQSASRPTDDEVMAFRREHFQQQCISTFRKQARAPHNIDSLSMEYLRSSHLVRMHLWLSSRLSHKARRRRLRTLRNSLDSF